MKKAHWLHIVIVFFAFSAFSVDLNAQVKFQIYPVRGVFLSDKARENTLFSKGITTEYGGGLFVESFKKTFPNTTDTIDDSNKYSTFVAYLQIPRVSKYEVEKTTQLIDLYLPITMSINFANMVTGESLYSFSKTHYGIHKTTRDSGTESEQKTIELYRDTYNDLFDDIMKLARANFNPIAVDLKVKKNWNGYYILDKGGEKGISKGDILVDQYSNQLSVVYASSKYSVGKQIIGDPKPDSAFFKYANDSIDAIKKPKVMLLLDNVKNEVKSVTNSIIYQLFSNALGKKATFSLIFVDKSFYDVQNTVKGLTKLQHAVTQQRELPDYFLRLYFHGPFYTNVPTNKTYVSYDNYAIMTCGDFLDKDGRVMYAKCVDDKISDEITGSIRYTQEAREEIIVKNGITKLANDFIENIKFKHIEYEIEGSDKNQVFFKDKFGVLNYGSTLNSFHKLGKIDGIEGDVYVPTWSLNVSLKEGDTLFANKILPLSPGMPAPTKNDKIFIDTIAKGTGGLNVLKLCDKGVVIEGDSDSGDLKKIVLYAVESEISKHPFYDTKEFKSSIEEYTSGSYGFSKGIKVEEVKTNRCIEPIVRLIRQSELPGEVFTNYKYSVIAGLKVYEKDAVVWKKGIKQSFSLFAPKGFEKPTLDFELGQKIFSLLTNEIVKKYE